MDKPVGIPAVITEARKRWIRCSDAEENQRKRILAAKKFRAGDQWPADIRRQREGGNTMGGQMPQPARPCLTVDRLSQPVRQSSNQIKQADFGFSVAPNGGGATDKVADIYKGAMRHTLAMARAESPVEWAADQAIEGGLAWFRMRTDYVFETWDGPADDPQIFDQEIKLERITNNLSVYCDPSANKPTRSDAQFMFVTDDVDKDEHKRRWPKADFVSLDQMMATGDMPGWVDKDTYRIAEYWRIEYKDKKYTVSGKTRTIRVPIVKMSIIDACQVLEENEWAGSRIPIIPIIWEELNIDGQVHCRGMIEEGMDAQRMVNYTYSGGIEVFALGSKSPYIVEEEQIGDYKAIWDTANAFNYAWLPYKSVPNAPPPTRSTAEAPIQAAVMLMQTSEDAIKATTGVPDAALGNVSPTAHSGRAIQSLQQQSDLATAHGPDNVKRAFIYAGELMVEILPKITRPGQVLHILGADEETQQVMVGQAFKKGPDGRPQALNGPDEEQAAIAEGVHQFFDLTKGRYSVTATLGKATATKREEGSAALGDLIPNLPPEMAAVATVEYIKALSFPGSQKLAEKLEKALPPALQDQPDSQLPPQIQAQLQGLQAQNQQLQQAVQLDQAKQQAMLQKAQGDQQVEMQKAQMEDATKRWIAQLVAQTGLTEAEIKAQSEDQKAKIAYLEQMVSGEKEARLEAAANMHEHHIQGKDHAHEAALTAMEQAHQLEMSKQQADTAQAQQGAQMSHEQQMAQQAQENAANSAE